MMLVHLQLLLSHLNSIPHQTSRCADCPSDCQDSDRKYRHMMGYLAARISDGVNAGILDCLSRLHDELAAERPYGEAERRAYEQCLQDLRLSIGRLGRGDDEPGPPVRQRTLCAVK
jgi:hypothetical protein